MPAIPDHPPPTPIPEKASMRIPEKTSRRKGRVTGRMRREGSVDGDRLGELERKAAGEGLTDEEAAELGRLYAERRGERPEGSGSIKDADTAAEDEESQERRELDAA